MRVRKEEGGNFEENQAPLGKEEGISLQGDFEQRHRGGGNSKIKRFVSNTEIQIALNLNSLYGFKRRKGASVKTQHPTPKGRDQKVNKGKNENVAPKR